MVKIKNPIADKALPILNYMTALSKLMLLPLFINSDILAAALPGKASIYTTHRDRR